jgi:hypothetical protein
LIDFADARSVITSPDFVGLITIGDFGFVHRTLAHHGLPKDATFHDRLVWVTRNQTLHWLTEVLEYEQLPPEHLAWVTRAFAELP